MGSYYLQRHRTHLQQLSKYLRYVFNDHLMILLFFLLGGMMVVYADFLKQNIHFSLTISRLIIIGIAIFISSFGKLATLFQEADNVFLIAKEKDLKQYLQFSIFISLVLPTIFLSLTMFLAWPFVLRMHAYTKNEYLFLWLALIILKYFSLIFQAQQGYFNSLSIIYKYLGFIIFYSCMLIPNGPIFSFIIAIILAVSLQIYFQKQKHLLNLPFLIAKEQARMQRIYKWLNLFTDVPQVNISVKRRKYFDCLLKIFSYQQKQTYLYLYLSQIVRGNIYGQLVLRLVIISNLLIILSHNFLLSLGLASLFLFLILVQLIPLYKELDYILWPNLYPIQQGQRESNFRSLLFYLSLVVISLNIVISLIFYSYQEIFLMLSILVAIFILFNILYLNSYFKRQNLIDD